MRMYPAVPRIVRVGMSAIRSRLGRAIQRGASADSVMVSRARPAPAMLAASTGIDVVAVVDGIRRVHQGLDPDQVAALLRGLAVREQQLWHELAAAKADAERARDVLQRWRSWHAATCCQPPPNRPAPRILGPPWLLSDYHNRPYRGAAEDIR